MIILTKIGKNPLKWVSIGKYFIGNPYKKTFCQTLLHELILIHSIFCTNKIKLISYYKNTATGSAGI